MVVRGELNEIGSDRVHVYACYDTHVHWEHPPVAHMGDHNRNTLEPRTLVSDGLKLPN
jgi:hypothetical protein